MDFREGWRKNRVAAFINGVIQQKGSRRLADLLKQGTFIDEFQEPIRIDIYSGHHDPFDGLSTFCIDKVM